MPVSVVIVDKAFFNEALKMLTSFIKEPKFFTDDFAHEIKIVDTEFQKNVSNEDLRLS